MQLTYVHVHVIFISKKNKKKNIKARIQAQSMLSLCLIIKYFTGCMLIQKGNRKGAKYAYVSLINIYMRKSFDPTTPVHRNVTKICY